MFVCLFVTGGKVDLFNVSPESQKAIAGIFIKNVLPKSPAARDGLLKKGDRILEVRLVRIYWRSGNVRMFKFLRISVFGTFLKV